MKEDKQHYPALDLHYSQTEPLATPIVLSLPENGMRLRFDGADQRLRLVEVLNFNKINVMYKGSELVKAKEDSTTLTGPPFKRVYQIFGASYPGEYASPQPGSTHGVYVLSWAGVAFNFPLLHSAWSPEKDHVAILGSHAASPATHMALFLGKSWPEARRDLFVREPQGPRLSALASRPKDSLPAEIEAANIHGNGSVELIRSHPPSSCWIVLNETTPQDLITELGPPDAIHKRADQVPEPEATHKRAGSMSRPMSNGRAHVGSQGSSYSSTGTDTYDADFDSTDLDDDPAERAARERFWCYFNHGMDILVGPPNKQGSSANHPGQTPLSRSPHLVVLKVMLHGNVPGSYAFNRHRRLRWLLNLPNTTESNEPITSESMFEDIKPVLMNAFANVWSESEMGRGKVMNRTWGAGPNDSNFFMPDAEKDLVEGAGSESWLGNTRLFTFPGLVFEVLENGAVSGVTVY